VQWRGREARINKDQFFRLLPAVGTPRPPFNSRAIGTPDGSSMIKIYRWLEGPAIGQMAEEGQKML
jgi:hypothetical protein